jgi:LmbE family N-acetylglucosaminyl deacetylase
VRRAILGAARTATVALAPTHRGSDGTCLVLAPHADDESLGCGGTIAARCAAGTRVVIAIATDGALSDQLGRAPGEVVAVRQEEARAAAQVLGVTPADVRFLMLPDGGLDHHEAELVDALRALVIELDPGEILVSSRFDPHPDHRALHRALLRVPTGRARILEYLVWGWSTWPLGAWQMLRAEHGSTAGLRAEALRVLRGLRKSRVGEHRHQKRAAIACYESQRGDGRPGRGVPPQMFEQHDGPWELLIAGRPARREGR